MRNKKLLTLMGSIYLILVLAAMPFLTACPAPAEEVTPPTTPTEPTTPVEIDPAKILPETIYAVCFEVGGSGYHQTASIASALMDKYGIKFRVLPSGTSVGRIAALTTGKVRYSFTADGAVYAVKGLYDFATLDWGVQDNLRVVLSHPMRGAFVCAGNAFETDTVTAYDLKGKRVVWVPGTASMNVANEACLAFGNLTWDDVIRVEFPSWAGAADGVIEGKADMFKASATTGWAYELDASPRGVKYVSLPPDDKEGWARFHKVISWYSSAVTRIGAGLSEDNPLDSFSYPCAIVLTLDSTPEDEVYAFVKAFDETFDMYKDAHPDNPEWQLEISGHTVGGVPPFHPGAIRYLRERGVWTAEDEAINNANIAELKMYKDAWDKVVVEFLEAGLASGEFPAYWDKRRVELIGSR